jgi:hypothetical protein
LVTVTTWLTDLRVKWNPLRADSYGDKEGDE